MILSFNDFKKTFYDLSVFRIFYIISLFFESISFTETIFGWINGVFVFWGFILSIHILFNNPEKLNIEGKKEALLL